MKFLVVEDHALFRDALRGVLKELDSGAVTFEAEDCRQTRQIIETHPDLDLILLDLALPDGSGLQLISELCSRCPASSVVVLSAHYERENVIRTLDLGASGFIPKSATRPIMLSALKLILSGEIYAPPEILLGKGQPVPSVGVGSHAGRISISPTELGLTKRQVDVLALMTEGKSNKAIGNALGLAEPTVKLHVRQILKALKVTNRTEVVVAVGELGWNFRASSK